MQPKLTRPTTDLAKGRPYVPSAATNVQLTWALFGWRQPDREKQQAEMKRLNPLPIPAEALA